MSEKKSSKQEFVRTLLTTPIDELFENQDVTFAGETEKDRAVNVARFTRVRGIIQRGANIFSGDDTDVLIYTLKTYVLQKPQDQKQD
jgi:hypothetical protein